MPMAPRTNQYQGYQGGYGVGGVIKGRLVTGMDEARAAQFDLDGTASYFPAPAENRIYVKNIDLNGLPVFQVYQLMEQKPEPKAYADTGVVEALQKRVEQLEELLKGVNANVQQLQSNATNANAQSEQQPDGFNAKHVR